MALTLADIQRWDATAIRDVSTALAKRGASAEEVRAGLGKLPLIATAARASLDRLSAYLATHGEEMAKVSSAAGNAVHGAIGGMTDEAMHVRKEALDQLDLAGRGNETVAAVVWDRRRPPSSRAVPAAGYPPTSTEFTPVLR